LSARRVIRIGRRGRRGHKTAFFQRRDDLAAIVARRRRRAIFAIFRDQFVEEAFDFIIGEQVVQAGGRG